MTTPIGISYIRAARWITASRVAELREQDSTGRLVLVETLAAAARAAGESDEFVAGIRGASLDDLQAAYEQLTDPTPPTERTDMSLFDPSTSAREAMIARAHALASQPLDGPPAEPATRLDRRDGGGNEPAVIRALRAILDEAARGELSRARAKEASEMLMRLGDLHEATPDEPAEAERTDGASDDDGHARMVARIHSLSSQPLNGPEAA